MWVEYEGEFHAVVNVEVMHKEKAS